MSMKIRPLPRMRHASFCRACRITVFAMLAILGSVVAACATTGSNTVRVQQLTATHYEPTQVVDVLDAVPTKPSERIARLEVEDPTGTATHSQLVAELVAAAQKLGANAVVLDSEKRAGGADVGFNPSGGQIQDVNSPGPVTLTAVAIRYVR